MNDRALSIRTYQAQDENDVVALWHQCDLVRPWNDPHEDIQRKMRVQPELFLLGVTNERVVASVMAGYDGHRGWVYYLAVAPEMRGQGFARALLEHVERELGGLGCPKVSLLVRATNEKVLGFYRHLGYVVDASMSLGKRLEVDGPGP